MRHDTYKWVIISNKSVIYDLFLYFGIYIMVQGGEDS